MKNINTSFLHHFIQDNILYYIQWWEQGNGRKNIKIILIVETQRGFHRNNIASMVVKKQLNPIKIKVKDQSSYT